MRTRIKFEWLFVASWLCVSNVQAQSPYAPGPGYAQGGPYGSPMMADPYCPPQGFQPAAYHDPGLYAELLPQDRHLFFDHDSRLDITLRDMFRGSWLRLEYMNSKIERDSEGNLLGAETTLTDDPANVFTTVGGDGITLFAVQAMSTRGLNWDDIQGIRGSFGLRLTDLLWFEGSAYGGQEQLTNVQVAKLPQPLGNVGVGGVLLPNLMVIPLLTNGVPGNTIALIDRDPFGRYTSQLNVAEANIAINAVESQNRYRVQPILGYRHEEYDEQLVFGGSFDNSSGFNPGGILPPVTFQLDSRTENRRDEFQFGARAELLMDRLTFGIQPKVGLGVNRVQSRLDNQLLFPSNSGDDSTQFAQTVDLELYCKLRITEWMNFRIGYDLTWMGRLGVADSSIVYDESFPLAGDLVTSRLRYENRTMHSLAIGGEIVLP